MHEIMVPKQQYLIAFQPDYSVNIHLMFSIGVSPGSKFIFLHLVEGLLAFWLEQVYFVCKDQVPVLCLCLFLDALYPCTHKKDRYIVLSLG